MKHKPFNEVLVHGLIGDASGQKMAKSRANVVNPNEIIQKYGADALRVYVMFMSPFEDSKMWTDRGIEGTRKWLERVFIGTTKVAKISTNSKLTSAFHSLVMSVQKEIKNFKFNVAISHLMVFVNSIYKLSLIALKELEGFLVLLSLFAPHLAEELLAMFKFKPVSKQVWPRYDTGKIKTSKKILPIQVNGKLRASMELTGTETKLEIIQKARQISNVKRFLKAKVVKEIYVPHQILNFVTQNVV